MLKIVLLDKTSALRTLAGEGLSLNPEGIKMVPGHTDLPTLSHPELVLHTTIVSLIFLKYSSPQKSADF